MERDWRDAGIEDLEAKLASVEAESPAKDAHIATLEQQIAGPMKQVGELAEKIGQNARNSHRPPPSDSPKDRDQRKGKSRASAKAARSGHHGALGELLSPEKVNKFVDPFPSHCQNYWKLRRSSERRSLP